MNILITGAKGYIGTALMTYLNENHTVTGISRDDFDLTNSVDTANWFKDKHFDVVIHTAAVGVRNPNKNDMTVLDTNLRMYYNLLEASAHYNRFINLGSGAEVFQQDTSYGLSKSLIRSSLLAKDKFFNLRMYGLFDENEMNSRFIKANVINYIRRHDIIVHQNRYMDFFYMKDFYKIIDYFISHNNPPKEYECGYRTTPSLQGIANFINTLSDYEVNIIYITPKNTLGSKYCVGNYTRPQIIGDYEVIGWEEGVREVYNKLLTIEPV
jgi:nucleoside-diphosphate-sugar epimerase